MKCIAITLPEFHEGEGATIAAMLQSGIIDRVHIRKPGGNEAVVRSLIESVPAALRGRLSLHDCHALAAEYGTGIHLNGRNPHPPTGFEGTISRSCHSLEEAALPCRYRFLSPVFDSISKQGYSHAFDLHELRGKVNGSFIALGGVTPDKLPLLADIGFGGAAFLGYLWQGDIQANLNNIEKFKKCCNS